jgi:hypothetical protein
VPKDVEDKRLSQILFYQVHVLAAILIETERC